MPITFCFCRASSTNAWPKGAERVICPSPAIDAIIAEVFRRGLVVAALLMLVSLLRVLAAPVATRGHRCG
jgi:hypothetical protein